MIIRNETTSGYAHVVDLDMMGPQIEALVSEVVSSALSAAILRQALAAGMNEIASVLRAVPIAEGRLLERGIVLVAKGNPDLVVLTDNLRLPVTKAASELVAMNDPSLVRSLSLDADNIDEMGFLPLSKTGAELLFELISQRCKLPQSARNCFAMLAVDAQHLSSICCQPESETRLTVCRGVPSL